MPDGSDGACKIQEAAATGNGWLEIDTGTTFKRTSLVVTSSISAADQAGALERTESVHVAPTEAADLEPEARMLLYVVDSNLTIASCFHATQKQMALKLLRDTNSLLADIDGKNDQLSAVSDLIIDRIKEFLSTLLDDSADAEVVQGSVDCMIRLCRVHHSLKDLLEVMHKVRRGDRLLCVDSCPLPLCTAVHFHVPCPQRSSN